MSVLPFSTHELRESDTHTGYCQLVQLADLYREYDDSGDSGLHPSAGASTYPSQSGEPTRRF